MADVDLALATVDGQLSAGARAGGIKCEQDDGVADVLRLTDATHRDLLDDPLQVCGRPFDSRLFRDERVDDVPGASAH
ncbi:hypothetical protein [Modestobacter sp. KNN46-3]|uniref:hypothetical protein n=1 Tax=Modestobacter sp. KNN46-3 TaxID=2711218 RepID=UPI001F14B991|nr:hypothetical protein [Modestobacter sp. KNN46-3]